MIEYSYFEHPVLYAKNLTRYMDLKTVGTEILKYSSVHVKKTLNTFFLVTPNTNSNLRKAT